MVTCPRCGATGSIQVRRTLAAKPLGTFSLAGAQLKTSAIESAVAECSRCDFAAAGHLENAVLDADERTFIGGHFVADPGPTGELTVPNSELSYKQTAALGYAAGKPWGAPPNRPATWASLVRRGLIVDLRTLALTEAGKQAVAELDSLNTRPQSCAGLTEAQVDHFVVADCGERHAHREHPLVTAPYLIDACVNPACDIHGHEEVPAAAGRPLAIPSSCRQCGAPRKSDGTRTCSASCVRGVDPRIADEGSES